LPRPVVLVLVVVWAKTRTILRILVVVGMRRNCCGSTLVAKVDVVNQFVVERMSVVEEAALFGCYYLNGSMAI
jgi:hypothetical protein